jgi:hypothetical protein
LIVEAIDIVDRLPDQERRWLTSGTRSGGWNMVGMTITELREIELLRVLSGIKPFDGTSRTQPQRDDTDRAMSVLEWLRWCNRTRNSERLVKAGVLLARSGEIEAVHRTYSPNRQTRSRQTTYEIKTRITGLILTGLESDHGISVGPYLSFREKPFA